jgi:uncharacterized protein YdaU (DUF1376 family)
MKAPAFQFYADDFIGGTVELTAQEVGCYVRLLCYQWGNGSVPESRQKLKRICGSRVSDSVLSKFPNGVNPRLEQERLKQEVYREKQAANGRASAQARFNHRSTTVQPPHQPNGNSPSPSPSPSPISILPEEHTAPAAHKKRGYSIPECFAGMDGFDDALQGWIDSRKQLRKPATDHAVQLMLGKLSQKPGRAIAALNRCILSGWQGFEWTWMDGDRNNGATLSPFDTQGGKRLMQ